MTDEQAVIESGGCTHACGMCDGRLVPAHHDGPAQAWTCEDCDAWHTAKDCCEDEGENR